MFQGTVVEPLESHKVVLGLREAQILEQLFHYIVT